MNRIKMTRKNNTKSAIYTVVGTDTYLGSHMMKHLKDRDQFVFGFAQNDRFNYDAKLLSVSEADNISDDMPAIDSEWIVICLEPGIGFEKYIAKLRVLFSELKEYNFAGDICYISSADICISDFDLPIADEPKIYPRNEHDLALATGENLLSVLSCSDKCYAVPHIMRIGVPYGNELGGGTVPGFVERLVSAAKNSQNLKIPMIGDAKRSLTHISDICESVICLMEAEYCPPMVNIPGEDFSLNEAASAVSEKYHVAFEECGLSRADDPDYFAGNQHLSAETFRKTVNFTPRYTFKQWLTDQ